jgi:hypothetical protein
MAAEAVYIRAIGQIDDRPVDGQKNVSTAGTAVCLVSESTPCAGVIIQAKRTNTGRIYVGGVAVPNNDTGGVYLAAGDVLTIQESQNLNQHYLNSTVDNEGVTYTYFRTVP